MSNQGAPAQHRSDDGWWHSVYTGPAGTLPDTPGAEAGEGSVDDWFDTAATLIGPQRTAPPGPDPAESSEAPEPVDFVEPPATSADSDQASVPDSESDPDPDPDPDPVPAPSEPSVDDWFDSAIGVIGSPAAPPTPAPVPDLRKEPDPVTEPRSELPPERELQSEPERESQPEPEPEAVVAPPPPLPERRRPRPMPAPAPYTPPSKRQDRPERQDRPDRPDPRAAARPDRRAGTPATPATPAPSADPTPPVAPASPVPTPAAGLSEPGAAPVRPSPVPPATPSEAERSPTTPSQVTPSPAAPQPSPRRAPVEPPVPYVGERPPTYGPEPTALPAAEPDGMAAIVPDTVVDGAQYGAAILRAVSVRGDSARFRGEPRRDALLVTRFGEGADGLLLAVVAAPGRGDDAAAGSAAAAEAARQLAAAIGRSRLELAADLRTGARDRLRYGLQRLTVRAAAPFRAPDGLADADGPTGAVPGDPPGGRAGGLRDDIGTEGGGHPAEGESGSLHCLLVSLDPEAGYRAAFGTGPGGLYLLRSGHWIDAYAARLLHHPDGEPPLAAVSPVAPRPFRFRLVPATRGDILLLCTPGLAGPIADEPAVARFLSGHWAHPHPPGTVDFLRQVQVRAKGYADDRTAAALWTE
ncbi:hypothetical protein [Kitasatospora paranensis]|uniref:hypothetical protein n=1 Tax=Kitasatospora paranensis TaxID=258053 RepID=UPI003618D4FF